MSRNTSNASTPTDGSWFLEAVGAVPKAPGPSQAVADLTAENAIVGDEAPTKPLPAAADPVVAATAPAATFDGDPGTSTSSFHPIPAPPPPPDLDAIAPRAVASAPPEPDSDLPSALRSRRDFRWPVVIALVALIGAIAVAAWWIPRSMDEQALATRQRYYDAAADIRNDLPGAQGALDAITNPSSGTEAVASAVPPIAELDASGFALVAVTAEALPRTYPVIPSDTVDALAPLQQRGSLLGASASSIARRLGNAYVYRTSIPLLLQTGPLPTSASTAEVNEISVTLASSLATDAGIVTDLPDSLAFEDVAASAVAALQRYGDWQAEYLEALTSEDSEQATALIAEIEALRSSLITTNGTALLRFRTDVDLEIIELAAELESYMENVSRL